MHTQENKICSFKWYSLFITDTQSRETIDKTTVTESAITTVVYEEFPDTGSDIVEKSDTEYDNNRETDDEVKSTVQDATEDVTGYTVSMLDNSLYNRDSVEDIRNESSISQVWGIF